jgi:hypothetical protein
MEPLAPRGPYRWAAKRLHCEDEGSALALRCRSERGIARLIDNGDL